MEYYAFYENIFPAITKFIIWNLYSYFLENIFTKGFFFSKISYTRNLINFMLYKFWEYSEKYWVFEKEDVIFIKK